MAGTILKLRNSLLFFFLSLLIREREREMKMFTCGVRHSHYLCDEDKRNEESTHCYIYIYTESEKNENKSAIHVQNAVNERIWNVNFHNNWHGSFLSNRPFLHVIQHHRAYIY